MLRERRAPDPIVPYALLATRTVAVASAALFLTTAALFAITVFVPLFLQTTTGATPTIAGLLLVPMMLGITALDQRRRPRDLAHRPLQALPDRRPGADVDRACRARMPSRPTPRGSRRA